MRPAAKLLPLGGLAFAAAIAAVLLLPPDRQAVQNLDDITNELCIVAPATPYQPVPGLDRLDPRPIPVNARCPVCGMYPARFPHWAAQTIFKDGAAHFFDSPVDMLAFLQRMDRHDKSYSPDDVAASYVNSRDGGQWIDVRRAFFVHGSRTVGPMRGADLPAFSSREAAEAFSLQQGGRVLGFAEITPELVQSLNRNRRHRH